MVMNADLTVRRIGTYMKLDSCAATGWGQLDCRLAAVLSGRCVNKVKILQRLDHFLTLVSGCPGTFGGHDVAVQ